MNNMIDNSLKHDELKEWKWNEWRERNKQFRLLYKKIAIYNEKNSKTSIDRKKYNSSYRVLKYKYDEINNKYYKTTNDYMDVIIELQEKNKLIEIYKKELKLCADKLFTSQLLNFSYEKTNISS